MPIQQVLGHADHTAPTRHNELGGYSQPQQHLRFRVVINPRGYVRIDRRDTQQQYLRLGVVHPK